MRRFFSVTAVVMLLVVLVMGSCEKTMGVCEKTNMKNVEQEISIATFDSKDAIIASFEGKTKKQVNNYTDPTTNLKGTLYKIESSEGVQEILVLDDDQAEFGWVHERNTLTYSHGVYHCNAPGPVNCTRLFGGLIVIID